MTRSRTLLLAAASVAGANALLVATPAGALPQCPEPGGDAAVCAPPTGPEPATLSLLALGVGAVAVARRRR